MKSWSILRRYRGNVMIREDKTMNPSTASIFSFQFWTDIFVRLAPSYDHVVKFITPILMKKVSHVTGLLNIPTSGPFILAVNHIGPFFDSGIIIAIISKTFNRRMTFLCHRDSFWKFFGDQFLVKWTGLIPFDEHRKKEIFEEMRQVLLKGDIVGIYPEGIKNLTPFLLKPKTGMVRLAIETGAPVIPIGVRGPKQFYKTIFGFFQYLFSRKNNIEVHIGKPMFIPSEVRPQSKEELITLSKPVMKALAVLAKKEYRF